MWLWLMPMTANLSRGLTLCSTPLLRPAATARFVPPAASAGSAVDPAIAFTNVRRSTRPLGMSHSRGLNLLARAGRRSLRLEQLRCEHRQIVAPIEPGVGPLALDEHRLEAVFLQELHRAPRGVDQEVLFARAEPQEVEAAFGGGIVQRGKILFFPRFTERRGRRRWRGAARPADDPGAEHADVCKLLKMRNRNVQ